MGSLAAVGGSLLAQGASAEQARATTLEGAESQARTEQMSREAQQREFERQIERQQPFLETGEMALSSFVDSLSGGAEVSNLPATQIQRDMITDALGETAPSYITDQAFTNLEAVEAEKQKGRLSDLISAGLGGTMSATGSGVNLGTQLSQSLASEAGTVGQSLQDAATLRQQNLDQITSGLSGLPAYVAATRTQPISGSGVFSDYQTTQYSPVSF